MVCNANREVTYATINGMGSTHDATSWDLAELSQQIERGELPSKYFLNCDDAYRGGEQYLVPYGGKDLPAWKDNYNYYQSSLRIEVECTLGIVQARWGVLWRPLRCRLALAPYVAMACFTLHNICIRAGMASRRDGIQLSSAAGEADGATRGERFDPVSLHPRFQSDGYYDSAEVGRGANAPSAQRSTRRDRIGREVERLGHVRPPPVGRLGRPTFAAPAPCD